MRLDGDQRIVSVARMDSDADDDQSEESPTSAARINPYKHSAGFRISGACGDSFGHSTQFLSQWKWAAEASFMIFPMSYLRVS